MIKAVKDQYKEKAYYLYMRISIPSTISWSFCSFTDIVTKWQIVYAVYYCVTNLLMTKPKIVVVMGSVKKELVICCMENV